MITNELLNKILTPNFAFSVASRGIIAASSSLRPCMKHIAQRIKDADDRGASKLFAPVMKMVEGVLKKLFLCAPDEAAGAGGSVRASSIKFLEILTLVCSRKPQDPGHKRRGHVASGNSTAPGFDTYCGIANLLPF